MISKSIEYKGFEIKLVFNDEENYYEVIIYDEFGDEIDSWSDTNKNRLIKEAKNRINKENGTVHFLIERQLADVLGQANDYKVCKSCGRVNWYENKSCIDCEGTRFDHNSQKVIEKTEKDIQYYVENGWVISDHLSREEAEEVYQDY